MPTHDDIVSALDGVALSHLGSPRVSVVVKSAISRTLPKLEDDRPREYTTVASLRDRTREGDILRGPNDTRAIRISWSDWRLEPAGTYGTDDAASVVPAEWITQNGPWRLEASAPPFKRHREVVYLDLDGTGRKVYAADASPYEVKEYEKKAKAWEKAGKPDDAAPRSPSLFYVVTKGTEYTVTPARWYGVSNAVEWETLNEPRASRRSEAAKKADRRTLSPEAEKSLDAVVLDTLPSQQYAGTSHALSLADIRADVENNRGAFRKMLNGTAGGSDWTTSLELQDADRELLEKAEYSKPTGERLIAASIRRLVADGWAKETVSHKDVKAYVKSSKCIDAPEIPRDAEESYRKADKTFKGYPPERTVLWDAYTEVRKARGEAHHPFATNADVQRFNASVDKLRWVATNILTSGVGK